MVIGFVFNRSSCLPAMSSLPLMLLLVAVFTSCRATSNCGKNEFDEMNATCCGGVIHQKKEYMMCCGREWVSSKDYYCIYNMSQIRQKYYCHGSFFGFYNPSIEICCNGNVIRKSPRAACCGGIFYNPAKAVCVENKVKQIEVNPESE